MIKYYTPALKFATSLSSLKKRGSKKGPVPPDPLQQPPIPFPPLTNTGEVLWSTVVISIPPTHSSTSCLAPLSIRLFSKVTDGLQVTKLNSPVSCNCSTALEAAECPQLFKTLPFPAFPYVTFSCPLPTFLPVLCLLPIHFLDRARIALFRMCLQITL